MLTSMKGEINNSTIIVGDFHTPLTPLDISTKQKINKETQTLNDTIDQLDLTDIYRTFQKRKQQPTPIFLPRESCGQRSLVSCRPQRCIELDTTEATQRASMHWRSKWQPSPVFLPGESQGRWNLVGCHLCGRTESDTTKVTQQQQQHRTFHPKTMNFTSFSSAHETFSRIYHILGHKSSLGKFKKIEIIPNIFSDHNVVRLDVNYRGKKLLKIQTYGG